MKKFKLNDKVKVIANTNGSVNDVGDVGIITEIIGTLDDTWYRVTVEGKSNVANKHKPADLELYEEIKTMKKFKNKLTVIGDLVLLEAFSKKLDELGYTKATQSHGTSTYLEINFHRAVGTLNGYYAYSPSTHNTVYTLPQDWDVALKLAAEEVEVVVEYVKHVGNYEYTISGYKLGSVYKVDSQQYVIGKGGPMYRWKNGGFAPATKEDYDAYQESLKEQFEVGKWYHSTCNPTKRTAIFKYIDEDYITGFNYCGEITINGYKAEFGEEAIRFGCAKFSKTLFPTLMYVFEDLNKSMEASGNTNRTVSSIKLGCGDFTFDQIKQIVEYYNGKN